jgi:GNAT superfamily N-acetyltransferase
MESIEYIRATAKDIQILTDMRLLFSNELIGKQPQAAEEILEVNLKEYFSGEINKTYFSWYATVDGEVAAIAGMGIRVQPGNFKNPSGKWGYLMSVYTKPEYRKRGLSGELIQRLIETAKDLGITALELHATQEGEPVYLRKGFFRHNEPTYRMFI